MNANFTIIFSVDSVELAHGHDYRGCSQQKHHVAWSVVHMNAMYDWRRTLQKEWILLRNLPDQSCSDCRERKSHASLASGHAMNGVEIYQQMQPYMKAIKLEKYMDGRVRNTPGGLNLRCHQCMGDRKYGLPVLHEREHISKR